MKGNNPAEIVKTVVEEFLNWADSYPKDATRLATDILLSIRILQNESLINTLSEQINTKIFYDKCSLGHLEENNRKSTFKKHFKFSALADLARFGPRAFRCNSSNENNC